MIQERLSKIATKVIFSPKYLGLILFIFIIVGLMFGIHYYQKNLERSQNYQKNLERPQNYQKNLEKPQIIKNTTDWKEYVNSTYAFSFRYPLGWQVIDLSTDREIQILESSRTSLSLIEPGTQTVNTPTFSKNQVKIIGNKNYVVGDKTINFIYYTPNATGQYAEYANGEIFAYADLSSIDIYKNSIKAIFFTINKESQITDEHMIAGVLATIKKVNESETFFKRQFDPQSMFYGTNISYPSELINIPNGDLVGMKCTHVFTNSDYGPYDPNFFKQEDGLFTETQKEALLHQLTQTAPAGDNIDSAAFCKTEDNRTVVSYTVWDSAAVLSYYAIFDQKNNFINSTPISSKGTNLSYFSCGVPLQLTNENIIYANCNGSPQSAIFGHAKIIYEINVNNKINKKITECTDSVDKSGKVIGSSCN